MCLLVLVHRTVPGRPVVVGANRDERYDRGGEPPRRAGAIVSPIDPEAGGTWIGATDAGLFVGIANRRDPAPAPPAPRSRGLLVADLLRAPSVEALEASLRAEEAGRYRPFALLAADPAAALHARWDGRALAIERLGPGVHILSNLRGPRDFDVALVTAALEPFASPEGVFDRLADLLRRHDPGPFGAVTPCLHGPDRGTTSSAIIAAGGDGGLFYLHAQGPPCRTAYEPAA